MLRSKATAALMKLKEIDRKYKIKSSEDVKIESNLSDISEIDSSDEISKHLAGSGDKLDTIMTNTRTKLDIRMPDAHMERTVVQERESELVTIFDKSKKLSPKSQANISPRIIDQKIATEKENLGNALEEESVSETLQITSLKNPSLSIISEEGEVANTETSISEDVPEVVSSSHPVSNHLEADVSREITLKSIESISDADEGVKSDLDEDPSTLVASRTYSDDFVKTFSSENAKESNTSPAKSSMVAQTGVLEPELPSLQAKYVTSTSPGCYQPPRWSGLDKNTEPESKDIVDDNAGLSNQAKKVDSDLSEEIENPPHQRSPQTSSARSGKERRRSRRSHTSSSSRDDELQESPSSSRQKDLETTSTPGTSNPSKGHLQSSQNSAITNRSGNDKDLKYLQTVFFPEAHEDQRDAVAYGVSWSSKDDQVSSKTEKLKHTRAKDSSAKEPPPNHSKERNMNKQTSVIQPVPSTRTGPVSKCLKFSKDDEVGLRASKHRSVSRGPNKRHSNKRRTQDSLGSRRRTKGGSLRQCKNQTEEEPGFGREARDVDRLRQQIKELRLQQERDQLRARVRGYVQQMMNEQRRLSARDCGFRGSIDQFDYSATGSGQAESLRSFFKPLDLPNVAAFKRPDIGDDQAAAAADLDNKRHLHLQMIRERILGIRHWLKQQFILYKDYSSLVSSINAKYIPVTLKDTKKMIHDMQQFYNDRERRRHRLR